MLHNGRSPAFMVANQGKYERKDKQCGIKAVTYRIFPCQRYQEKGHNSDIPPPKPRYHKTARTAKGLFAPSFTLVIQVVKEIKPIFLRMQPIMGALEIIILITHIFIPADY